MPTLAESPEAQAVLRDIKPNEVSAVDVPAIGEPHMVLKSASNRLDVVIKANEPKDSMSNEELEAAREARSSTYGIEVLEEGSHLTYPSGYPTTLEEYGDPVNLKYPTDTPERAQNARVRFKQNADTYKKDSSKKVVHERIVRAELKHGIEPGYDPDDPLDQMLPSDLKDEMTESGSTEKQGGQMTKKKLDENAVPRPVMKVVHKRLKSVLDSVGELRDVSKNLKVAEDGDERAPQFLVDMTKSVAAEIRSLQPDDSVRIQKRAIAEPVLSLHSITKRAEDIEKANAVSYLVRDRWIDVTQSISEYMTTYVEGIEHDDNGPMLIPDGLDSTVDKSAGELEDLAKEHSNEDTDQDGQTETEPVEKTLKSEKDFDLREAFDMVMKSLAELKASKNVEEDKMDKKTTKSEEVPATDDQATSDGEGSEETGTEAGSEETGTDDSQSDDTAGDESGEEGETEPEAQPATKGADDLILKAIAAMEKKFDQKFGDVEKAIDDVRGVANASAEKVDKALRKRADSRGGAPDSTTKVAETKKKKDEGSFSGVLGLPGVE